MCVTCWVQTEAESKKETEAPSFQPVSVKGSQVCFRASPPHSNMRSASLDQHQGLPECAAPAVSRQDVRVVDLWERIFSLLVSQGDMSHFHGSLLKYCKRHIGGKSFQVVGCFVMISSNPTKYLLSSVEACLGCELFSGLRSHISNHPVCR